MIRMRTGFIVLVLVVIVLFAMRRTLHADSGKMPAVGQMAPDFTLPSQAAPWRRTIFSKTCRNTHRPMR